MANPLVTAKKPGPTWTVEYNDLDRGQPSSIVVIGEPTIDEALRAAKESLDAVRRDWYRITRIELNPSETEPLPVP